VGTLLFFKVKKELVSKKTKKTLYIKMAWMRNPPTRNKYKATNKSTRTQVTKEHKNQDITNTLNQIARAKVKQEDRDFSFWGGGVSGQGWGNPTP
jgi:hypothetical protein